MNRDADHYVEAGVTSYDTFDQTFYYTHHRHKDAGQYV